MNTATSAAARLNYSISAAAEVMLASARADHERCTPYLETREDEETAGELNRAGLGCIQMRDDAVWFRAY